MKVTLLMPTVNEIEGMKNIMPQVDHGLFCQVLVVDARSTDGTPEWAEKQGYDVVRQKTFGLKNCYLEALPHIKGDTVIAFSPDGNSVPDVLPQLIEKYKEGYDMVIASRYKQGAKSEDDDHITGFGNWMFTRLINLLHGGNYTDAMVMYRIFPKSLIQDLDLDKPITYWPEKFFFTNVCLMPILSIRAAKYRLKIAEIPGDEPARIGGERKLQIVRWGSVYLIQTLTEKFLWKRKEIETRA